LPVLLEEMLSLLGETQVLIIQIVISQVSLITLETAIVHLDHALVVSLFSEILSAGSLLQIICTYRVLGLLVLYALQLVLGFLSHSQKLLFPF